MRSVFIKSSGSIPEDFGTIQPGLFYHYINHGQWSLHEMLEYILNFTGPANVRITSYGISETAIRAFVNMMDSGLIKKLYLLFDVSTKRNKLSLLLFASNVATKVFIGANHAKLILVETDAYTIALNTSANLTINRRSESGCLITHQKTAIEYHNAILDLFESSVQLDLQ